MHDVFILIIFPTLDKSFFVFKSVMYQFKLYRYKSGRLFDSLSHNTKNILRKKCNFYCLIITNFDRVCILLLQIY